MIAIMKRRFDEQYESVTSSSEELVSKYRANLETDASDASLAVVDYRAGTTEFELGRRYSASSDPLDRVVGCDVLSQLGWGDDCFRAESIAILLKLIHDPDDRVIASAAIALGHRKAEEGIEFILPLVLHANPDVRYAAVHGLMRHENIEAVKGLIALSRDENRDVKNWSAFALGTLSDLDLPIIREALIPLLDEPDDEIRGEALIGLAKRQDRRVMPSLERELSGEYYGSWCVEAAALMADPVLADLLEDLRNRVPAEEAFSTLADFEAAIQACRGGHTNS